MAGRDSAVFTDLWGDDDWRELSVRAQWLYSVLLSRPWPFPGGGSKWVPGRFAALARDIDAATVTALAEELRCAGWLALVNDGEVALPLLRRERTSLYRYWDASGSLLYVGISNDPDKRDRQHGTKPWKSLASRRRVEWFATRPEALLAEAIAICTERPRFNVLLAVK